MGSKLGWVLAGIFGVFIVVVLVKVLAFPSPTPPTRATTGPGMLILQKPGEPLTTILPAAPSGAGDAGDNYQQAMQLYHGNIEALRDIFQHYRALVTGEYHLTDDQVNFVKRTADVIAAGTAKKSMTYYFRLTPKKIEIPYRPVEAGQFQDLANVPQMLSIHYVSVGAEAGYPLAEKRLFDILVLGNHLVEERARLDIVRTGIGLQKVACKLLEQLYAKWKKPERLRAVRKYRGGLRMISGVYSDLYGTIWQLDRGPSGAYGPNPGDIFNLVENHADRAVRVEAILSLGVVKLTCTSRGDRRMARVLINRKLASPDPLEQAAAACADALDQNGLNRLASGQ